MHGSYTDGEDTRPSDRAPAASRFDDERKARTDECVSRGDVWFNWYTSRRAVKSEYSFKLIVSMSACEAARSASEIMF